MVTVKLWAYRANVCCEVVENLDTTEDKSSTDNMHKEERKAENFHNQVG